MARRDGDDDEKLDYHYIMNMPQWATSQDDVDAILAKRDSKAEELYQLQKKTHKDLWRDDLDAFMQQLQVILLCTDYCSLISLADCV